MNCLKMERNSGIHLTGLISNYKRLAILLKIAWLAQKHARYPDVDRKNELTHFEDTF